jgi:SnoaL-like domain
MLTLQQISDRIEIDELLARYSHAVDSRNWPLYRTLFTADARIDYTEMGGDVGGVDEITEYLSNAMPMFTGFQHMVSNIIIEFDGSDRATVRSILYNPMILGGGTPEEHIFVCGLWYRDVVVRTTDGWKFQSRYEERSYTYSVTPGMGFAPPPVS